MAECKCGQTAHPAYGGSRCEDCFALAQAVDAGRANETPAATPDETIERRARAGRDIWTGLLRGDRDKDAREARLDEALRLRRAGYVYREIADRIGVSTQAARKMTDRAAAREGTTLPAGRPPATKMKATAKGIRAERRRAERAATAVRLREEGLSLNEVGRRLGVTGAAVFSLLKREEARRAEAAAEVDAKTVTTEGGFDERYGREED